MSKQQEREFPTIEELSQGFSEYRLPQIEEIVGQTYTLNYETVKIIDRAEDKEEKTSAIYTAVSPRKNIIMIDCVCSYGDTKSLTTVIDLNKNIATTLTGLLPNREEVLISQFERGDKGLPLTSVKGIFEHAAVNTAFTEETEKHEFTTELVGERIAFQYSSNDMYEHVYLNENYFTWHCIKGIDKGLCDTDRCFYLKLEDNLYWFIWMEKVVPTIGTVVEDLSPRSDEILW